MRGGARQNAGRRKGSVSKATEVRQEILARATAEGLSPLEFMLEVLRDETKPFNDRFEAAKAAAPYTHPKLASVEHKGDANNPLGIAIMSAVPRDDDQPANGHDKAAHH
jgi:hypothetical protein